MLLHAFIFVYQKDSLIGRDHGDGE